MIEFRSLGSLTVTIDGVAVPVGGPRQRRLLAMLLIHRDSVVSVDRLAEAVFAGEPTDAASTTMRSYIARIRKVIEPGGPDVEVVTQAPGYMLRAPSEHVDVARFEHLLAEGQHQLGVGDAGIAVATIRQALAAWSGDAYAEFSDEEWVQPEAQRLDELRVVANERLIDAELACGRAVDVVGQLDSQIAAHPLREGFRAQLMLALYRSGRQVDALRAYRDYRQYLVDEIGLDPSPSLADLERRVLEHDPSLLLDEPAGQPLLGYRLGARLGSGPNGTVHAARLPGFDHDFAISVLTDERVDTPGFIRSFEATAQQVASLHHPSVVPLHDFWREPGSAYVVTRRPAGLTMRDRLEQKPITFPEIARIVHDVGGALAVAAQRGLVHGWITLDNIVIGDTGDASITNFVICPVRPPCDVADFAVVIEQCLDRVADRSDERCARIKSVLSEARADSGRPECELPTMAAFVTEIAQTLVSSGDLSSLVDAGARPNPFKGLRSFDESDADQFFGRTGLIEELLERLRGAGAPSRLVLVVGGSGSGKSSVVRAGLLPRIRLGAVNGSDRWFVTTMLPGSAPFKELAEALRRVATNDVGDLGDDLADGSITLDDAARQAAPGGQQLLIVIDQLEELFTLAPDDDQRSFLDCLAGAISTPGGQVRVVATLRADFFDRPLAFQGFGDLVGDATVAVAAMSPAALEAAIVRPVESVRATAEPALVAELVAAVADQSAALPSLQFTLYELAERRADRCLTLDDYRALGGVDAAIASRAETLYRGMDGAGREAIRQVFEQLVVIDPDGEPTGRRSERSPLTRGADGATVNAVIERWTTARLLTGDNDPRTRVPTVQVAHEALLRTWPRLGEWIDADRDAIITLGNLRDATATWEAAGRDEDSLYRGARLLNALDVVQHRDDPLPDAEAEFLVASCEVRDREELEAAEQADRQARANRRLRVQFAVIACVLVVALVGGFIALDQRRGAQREREVAFARELAAASVANVAQDPDRSILLGLAAVNEARSGAKSALPEAESALHQAVTNSAAILTVPGVGGTLDWSSTDDVFVTEGPEESGMIDLRSTVTGESVRSWKADAIDVNDVRFSPDGSALLVVGDDGAAIWDPDTGERLARIEGEGSVRNPSFSADGSKVMTNWKTENKVRVNDARTGALISETDGSAGQIEISPDGTVAAVGLGDDPYGGVFGADGEPVFTFEGVDNPVTELAWSPDGRWIAAGLSDGSVRVFDGSNGHLAATGIGHTAVVIAIDWSADGRQIVSGSNDGTARVWAVGAATLTQTHQFESQELSNGVAGVAFSPDGTKIVASDTLVTASKFFDLDPSIGAELARFQPATSPPILDFSPDGLTLFSETEMGLTAVFDAETGEQVDSFGDGSSWFAGLSPDGKLAAMVHGDGSSVQIWDVATRQQVVEWLPPAGSVAYVVWSPDSGHIAVVHRNDAGTSVSILDRRGDLVATRTEPATWFPSVSFLPDRSELAIARSGFERVDPAADSPVIWAWEPDRVVRTVKAEVVDTIDFDNRGTRMLTVRGNSSVAAIRDAASGELLTELVGHSGLINLAGFMPDGERAYTTSTDGTARIWDAVTGEELLVLHAGGELWDARASADGRRLATIGQNGLVQVWALDINDLVAIAEDRVTRPFTELECRQFLHIESCDA